MRGESTVCMSGREGPIVAEHWLRVEGTGHGNHRMFASFSRNLGSYADVGRCEAQCDGDSQLSGILWGLQASATEVRGKGDTQNHFKDPLTFYKAARAILK
ncbi:hypothetical protein NDU88_007376 [Pleurodeles waltl]|uniref:Uncharacterized protein n=1 Tax=Pleurodeles waltl TaxID=8319 RepID=A0AAV7TZN2_PLEWA|nr:hypothetical protein NDU88_007376 [Pleurodeles waltl]